MKLHELYPDERLTVDVTPEEKKIILDQLDERAARTLMNGKYLYYDRDDFGFHQTFVPLDKKGPRGTLDEVIARKGHAAVLDFGTSTGHQLYSLIDRSEHTHARHPGTDLDSVVADVMSGENYAHLGSAWRTRAAFIGGALNYDVVDLNQANEYLPTDGYDLVVSYDGLVGLDSPAPVLRGLARALRPEGTLYMNVTSREENEVLGVMSELHDSGHEISSARSPGDFYVSRWSTPEPPVAIKITAPAAWA
ncbi:MAG: class I SAM-dependent methyltransferase [Candidatus Saccharimonadales bacterium]